jgi:hypothetical protein
LVIKRIDPTDGIILKLYLRISHMPNEKSCRRACDLNI